MGFKLSVVTPLEGFLCRIKGLLASVVLGWLTTPCSVSAITFWFESGTFVCGDGGNGSTQAVPISISLETSAGQTRGTE